MKHLFYIHSCITYIVSVSVVAELNLRLDEVVFVYGRGFTHEEYSYIKSVRLPESLMILGKISSRGAKLLMLRKFREITTVDRLVTDLVQGDKYIAYLPLTKNYLMQLLATHPNCSDLVFIEEGMLTYTGKINIDTNITYGTGLRGKAARFITFLNHGNRSFYYRPYTYSQPMPLYVLRDAVDATGPALDVRVLRSVVVPPLDVGFKFDGGCILIIETVVEDGITSSENYLHALDAFITDYLKDESDTIWIRFRPNHPVPGEVLNYLKNRSLEVKLLPDQICAESLFYHSRDLTVVGLSTSLLFYAAIWGHESYSLLKTLFEIDDAAEHKYQSYVYLPQAFYDHVNML